MKRSLLLLILAVALLLCGCGNQNAQPEQPSGGGSAQLPENNDPVDPIPDDPEPTVNMEQPEYPGAKITGYDGKYLSWDGESGILYFEDPRFVGSYFRYRHVAGTAQWATEDRSAICVSFTQDIVEEDDKAVTGPEIRFTVDVNTGKVLEVEKTTFEEQTVDLFDNYIYPMAKRMALVIHNAEAGFLENMNPDDLFQWMPQEDGSTPIPEKELETYNRWFAWDPEAETYPISNNFLACVYSEPAELDLHAVFGHGCGDRQNGQISDAERQALAAFRLMYAEYEVYKANGSQMDDILKTYTGIGLQETNGKGLDGFVYLEEYDTYYTGGNLNWDSYSFIEGYRYEDGTVKLLYENEGLYLTSGCGYCVVTLRPVESGEGFHGYWFVSNLPHIG